MTQINVTPLQNCRTASNNVPPCCNTTNTIALPATIGTSETKMQFATGIRTDCT